MTTYYVRKTGDNSNAGTSSGAAWLTIGKALGASGISSGDIVYIGAGTYREAVSVAMTSATVETKVIADLDGFYTGDAGEVIWTAYTVNDKTTATGAHPLSLVGRDFLTFEGFVMIGGASNYVVNAASISGSNNIILRRCLMICTRWDSSAVGIVPTDSVSSNWTFDSCIFVSTASGQGVYIQPNTVSGSDWDLNITIKNCLFLVGGGGDGVRIAGQGAAAGKPGGVRIYNCTIINGGNALETSQTSVTGGLECVIYNSLMYQQNGAAIVAAVSGQILEDYNIILTNTARTNVTAGANSVGGGVTAVYAPTFQLGQEWWQGKIPRPAWSPFANSPFLGFGNQSDGPSIDLLGRLRPAGGVSALKGIGAYERGNTFARETGTVRTGSNAISITGPGYQEFLIPVDETLTTISVYVSWDTTYTGTKPQFEIDTNGEIDVSTETKTATGASGTWEQLALTSFTPTAKGIVKVRLLSNDTNGGGKMFADDFAVI